ncbi:TetR/AcrR family transcriptional regulator [uncultured Mycolicibacterium sp.]|uniref:TetR/AcrR family transcriptional regulator n=1 Tax=uncultured Mycolicibacterium sp. TaxID=2320817 RepID=UPI00261B986D|nr:TetR/AcrR family transcriptional regulator [uncultured Mycolicibacterium sp.]
MARPRDPELDAAICAAAREVVAEHGWVDTTLAMIARRAGVSVPTIYRRWAGKHELLEEAVLHLDTFELPDPTGDLRADLRTWVELFLRVATEPAARAAVPGLMAAYGRNPAAYRRLLGRGELPVRAALAELLAGAVAAGQADPDCDADTVFDLIRGATLLRAFTDRDEDDAAFCERITEAVWRSVRSRGRGGPGGRR